MKNNKHEVPNELRFHHRSNVEIFIYVCTNIDAYQSDGSLLLASISFLSHGIGDTEDLPSVNAFGVDLNLENEAKHR